MLLKQLFGLLRGRYLLTNPVDVHPLVVEKFKDGILFTPRFFVGQDGDTITAKADEQVVFEATVKLPSNSSEALFYVFLVHVLPLFRIPLDFTGLFISRSSFQLENAPQPACIVALIAR